MIASDANDVWISVVGAGGVLAAALIAQFFTARRTRQMNTSEHERSAAERQENRDAILFAIELVHSDVQEVKGDLKAHLGDELAHRRHTA